MTIERTPAEMLRIIVRNMDYTNEDFNERWSIEQLILIFRMHLKCGRDFFPHSWTERQVQEALRGIVPRWNDAEDPVFECEEGGTCVAHEDNEDRDRDPYDPYVCCKCRKDM